MVQRIQHRIATVGQAKGALGGTGHAVPQHQVAALFLGQFANHIAVDVDAAYLGEAVGFVKGKDRRLECIPRQHEPTGDVVEFDVALHVGELPESPLLHLAPGNIERILGRDGVGVVGLFEQHGLTALAAHLFHILTGRAALQGPVLRELFEGGAEARKIQVNATDAGLLELLDPMANGLTYRRFDILPIARFATWSLTRATD